MDFGIGFLSNNVMLPIIDFFYGVFPSYGLAIVALTLIIRFALYPLSAGSIRSMRRMRIVQPLMQKRMAEIKERYAASGREDFAKYDGWLEAQGLSAGLKETERKIAEVKL